MVVTTVKGFDGLGRTLAKQCDTFGKNLQTVELAGNRDVAAVLVGAVAANLGGRSITLSGVGKKGAKVGVIARPSAGKTVTVQMTGPAQLIENDTKAHVIIGRNVGRLGKGKGSRSAANKRKAKQELYDALFGGRGGGRLHLGGDQWVTGPIPHPGTKGKHPFRKGVELVRPKAPKLYQSGVNRALRRSFK